MKFDNLPNLNKGQTIRVFPLNGGKVEGEFAGIACGERQYYPFFVAETDTKPNPEAVKKLKELDK